MTLWLTVWGHDGGVTSTYKVYSIGNIYEMKPIVICPSLDNLDTVVPKLSCVCDHGITTGFSWNINHYLNGDKVL